VRDIITSTLRRQRCLSSACCVDIPDTGALTPPHRSHRWGTAEWMGVFNAAFRRHRANRRRRRGVKRTVHAGRRTV